MDGGESSQVPEGINKTERRLLSNTMTSREHETAATLVEELRQAVPTIEAEGGAPKPTPITSTIGLGVDAAMPTSRNATEASIKAVRDALERGMLHASGGVAIRVKLGVPPHTGTPEPLPVDLQRVSSALPAGVPVLSMDLSVGGLAALSEGPGAIGAVVACITLYQSSNTIEAAVAPPASSVHLEPEAAGLSGGPPSIISSQSMTAMPTIQAQQSVHRSMSTIDMLAHISAEIHDQQPQLQKLAPKSDDDSSSAKGTYYQYKKLPPGTTPKNNKRLFVKHLYTDLSQEVPSAEEMDLFGPNASLRTPNAAFPLKLHETLVRIEMDGHDDIIGWLPHGRSFKIHKNDEFVETILPKYFIMTKKSSFLRQLNLYGFNRLSGIGPDQGSYYHEKFLRGMKFLSRRMQRLKVNGNGIRAAGNPDHEPVLSTLPSCPPMAQAQSLNGSVTSPTMELPATDVSVESATDVSQRNSNGYQISFPLKLQRILDKLEAEGKTDTIAWLPHGRAFIVRNQDRFVSEMMTTYFNQTKYSSFQRQLHMYNFQRITVGVDKGAYHHPHFLRGQPELSLKMQRTRVNGKGTRRPGNPHAEPSFRSMNPLPTIASGTRVEVPVDATSSAVAEEEL